MLRLLVDVPTSVPEGIAIVLLSDAVLKKQGITIVTSEGTKMDVDLVTFDVAPEGRLV